MNLLENGLQNKNSCIFQQTEYNTTDTILKPSDLRDNLFCQVTLLEPKHPGSPFQTGWVRFCDNNSIFSIIVNLIRIF